MTSGSFSYFVTSISSTFTLLSSLYNSSVYSFHLFFIPSSSTIICPSLAFSDPILGVFFLVISLTFENIVLVLPFLPSSSISLHNSFRCFSLSIRACFWKSLFNFLTLSLSPSLFASLLNVAMLIASFDNHGVVLVFLFFGIYLSPVSKIASFIFSHKLFSTSSVSASSLSNISNLFLISTLYSCDISLQSYVTSLSPFFSVFNFICIVATSSS